MWPPPTRQRRAQARQHRRSWCVAQAKRVQRNVDEQVQSGHGPHGLAPTPQRDPPRTQRDEHGAGQPTEQGDGDDGAPVVQGEPARDHSKSGCVDRGGRGHSQPHPHRVKRPQAVDLAVRQQAQCRSQRAERHHAALVACVDPAAHREGHQAFGQQGQGKRQRGLGARQTQLGLHRPQDQRERVINRTPGDQLAQGQGPAQAHVRRPRNTRRVRATNALCRLRWRSWLGGCWLPRSWRAGRSGLRPRRFVGSYR